MTADAETARLRYFGTRVEPRGFDEWLADIASVLREGRRRWLSGHHNLHSLYLLQCEPVVRRFYARCDDCYVDGVPVRFLLRAFGQHANAGQRFSLMDHFLDLLSHAQRNDWSVFYLGSREPEVDAGRRLVAERFPALRMQLRHGYYAAHPEVVAEINAFRPDILLVGMGMPQQERWLLDNLDRLDAGFVTQAGGTLDYYTGAQARPPMWLSRAGFGWLYRLVHDPRRLWRRYLLEPCALLLPTLRQWLRYRGARR